MLVSQLPSLQSKPMSKKFRPWDPEQSYLFAPSPRDWLPENHLVYFLLDVVAQMDLSAILRPYQAEERGQPPFHPRMMVTLLLYGYATGTFSSRRLMARISPAGSSSARTSPTSAPSATSASSI